SMTLEQILLGAIDADRRPRTTPVTSAAQGWVQLPGLGAFATGLPNSRANVVKELDGGRIQTDNLIRRVALEPEEQLRDHDIRLQCRVPPVFLRFFEAGRHPLLPIPLRHRQNAALRRGLRLLAHLDPELHGWIVQTTRCVQLYCAEQPNSFATLCAHGTAF